jgi:hypothetical protein
MGKFGTKMSNTISVDPSSDSTQPNQTSKDFKSLVSACFPTETFEPLKKSVELTHDLCFSLGDENYKIYAHRAFVVERCDYFKTLLNDPFNEIKSETSTNEMLISLKEIDIEIFREVIFFIYSDCFSSEKLDENTLLDVLVAADLYLLPSLKRKCANELANCLRSENVFDLLRLSRLYDLKKLEFASISFLAFNIFQVSDYIYSKLLDHSIYVYKMVKFEHF